MTLNFEMWKIHVNHQFLNFLQKAPWTSEAEKLQIYQNEQLSRDNWYILFQLP